MRHLIGLFLQEMRAQDVGEEVVVAIPPALVVQRHHEQVAALQTRKHCLPTGLTRDGIAERRAEAVEN
jgi:hypothetical protein